MPTCWRRAYRCLSLTGIRLCPINRFPFLLLVLVTAIVSAQTPAAPAAAPAAPPQPQIHSSPVSAATAAEIQGINENMTVLQARLNEMELSEKDYRKYILDEYTFLKRPTIIIGEQIFIGSAPKTVKAMLEACA